MSDGRLKKASERYGAQNPRFFGVEGEDLEILRDGLSDALNRGCRVDFVLGLSASGDHQLLARSVSEDGTEEEIGTAGQPCPPFWE